MPNEENLIPFNRRTESEQREIARKGGIASGKKRRQAKAMAEIADLVASAKVPTQKIKDEMKRYGIPAKDQTMQAAVVMAMAIKAAKGDTKAARLFGEWIDSAQARGSDERDIDILSIAFESLEEMDTK